MMLNLVLMIIAFTVLVVLICLLPLVLMPVLMLFSDGLWIPFWGAGACVLLVFIFYILSKTEESQ